MYSYFHGSEALEKLLEQLPDDPPVLTDLFPDGLLPIPLLDIGSQANSQDRKKLRRIQWIPETAWQELRENLNRDTLLETLGKFVPEEGDPHRKEPQETSELHATINRISGTTGAGGGLYTRVVKHYPPGYRLHGYFAAGVFADEALNLLSEVGRSGYGADASTGLGQFELTGHDLVDWDVPDKANGWMSLSRHLPDPNVDPSRCRYRIDTHYGRLGGEFANSANPFKKPLLLCETGSLWKQEPDPELRPGYMLDNVALHSDANIRHVGYTLPYWVNWEDE